MGHVVFVLMVYRIFEFRILSNTNLLKCYLTAHMFNSYLDTIIMLKMDVIRLRTIVLQKEALTTATSLKKR